MPLSSYQVEWLLARLRRLKGGPPFRENGAPSRPERVEVTEGAALRAQEVWASIPPRPRSEVWPMDLADTTPRAPAVRYELERRAGSFMRPRHQPDVEPGTIPKMKR